MTRLAMSVVVLFVLVGLVRSQDTEEQKIQFDRAVKLAKSNANNWKDGIDYLIKRRNGVPVVEQITMEYRAAKDSKRHYHCLWIYLARIAPEDYSANMVAETINHFNRLVKSTQRDGNYRDFVPVLGNIGPKAIHALPSLEWIRDNDPDDKVVSEAIAAIRKIKAK